MEYKISYQKPHQQYIDIELKLSVDAREQITIHLPAWRPGRYELGNFAKNIQKFNVNDGNGRALAFKKTTKDSWVIDSRNCESVVINYNYYANQLNAGSTYLDEHQLYVNPVNCLLYQTEKIDEPCTLKVIVPRKYQIAIALKSINSNTFCASNYHELVDSPFIASPTIQHNTFKVKSTTFHLWFQGIFKADWKRIKTDFIAYTKEQIKLFGDFPVEEYHYLFQILPYSGYHGVEHGASTVISLGPSYSIMNRKERYLDLLGVSSHELFHTWNVKRIRPEEMWPYDYSQENYHRTGYLTEGATTWYGDLMLYRSGVFNDEEFFQTISQLLNRHFNNPGVLNLSVAESSFDTWLDGYEMGVPNRKSSIYVEGALITFLLDHEIRKSSKNKSSFDDLLRGLYTKAYKKGIGVSEEMYKKLAEELSGKKLDQLFRNYIYGTKDITKTLKLAFKYLGLEMYSEPTKSYEETFLGIRLKGEEVVSVFPDSIADESGIKVGDLLLSINGVSIKDNFSNWLEFYKDEQIKLKLKHNIAGENEIKFQLNNKRKFYQNYSVRKVKKLTNEQKKNFKLFRKTV